MSFTRLVAIPRDINKGIEPSGNKFMLATLGNPRSTYSSNCAPVTNKSIRIVTDDVGPFRLTGWAPAVESCKAVMADVKAAHPDLYAQLGTAGMLCARLVRGSRSAISNHSWGAAVDININGQLDARGNGLVQYGLTLLAPVFNAHGWYWGAGFRTEDAMHFECGRALVLKLAGQKPPTAVEIATLDNGDRGPRVKALQEALRITPADGIFGPATEAAVKKFQASKGLAADGQAGPKTLAALGMQVA